MKTLFITLITLTLTLLAQAATPKQEADFLAEVTKVLKAGDAKALSALVCWDGVPKEVKQEFTELLAAMAADKPSDIKLEAVPAGLDKGPKDSLVPVKVLAVKEGAVSLAFPVGEKAGRLMIAAPLQSMFDPAK